MSRRIRITLCYDGTDFHGWQAQPGLPTIQGALETVLAEIEGAPVPVAGSGRTDAGVHALAQVAAFTLANPIPVLNLRKAMNRLLPRDIRILECVETRPEFHPRFAAVAKTYEYRILRAPICPPFERRYVYHFPYALDDSRFVELAPLFEGEYDFSAFSAADERDILGRSKVRTIFSSRAIREEDRLTYRVRGGGFLKHMVRHMVGVLIECAKGNLERNALLDRLRPESGHAAGPAVPASGLYLIGVEYAG